MSFGYQPTNQHCMSCTSNDFSYCRFNQENNKTERQNTSDNFVSHNPLMFHTM